MPLLLRMAVRPYRRRMAWCCIPVRSSLWRCLNEVQQLRPYGYTALRSSFITSSNAPSSTSTRLTSAFTPMRPTRHVLPFRGPKPAAISMPRLSSARRTRASSTPSGMRITLIWGRRRAGGVYARSVYLHRDATQGGDAVEGEQRAVGARAPGDVFDRLPGTRGGLGVDEHDEFRRLALELRLDALGGDHLAQRRLDGADEGARPARHFRESLAEIADHSHNRFITGLEQVQHHRLEAGAPRAGHRNGLMVLGAEREPQIAHRLVHHREEIGIEMADNRRGEGARHGGVDIRRPGTEQQALRRLAGVPGAGYFSAHAER